MRNDESEARMFWDTGISTKYASKLTCKDVREFVENELNLRCGRITKVGINSRYGIDFIIRKPFSFVKNPFWADSLYIGPISVNKIVFTAYDFKFDLPNECFISEADRQSWIDYMASKFGKGYNEFMLVYSDSE